MISLFPIKIDWPIFIEQRPIFLKTLQSYLKRRRYAKKWPEFLCFMKSFEGQDTFRELFFWIQILKLGGLFIRRISRKQKSGHEKHGHTFYSKTWLSWWHHMNCPKRYWRGPWILHEGKNWKQTDILIGLLCADCFCKRLILFSFCREINVFEIEISSFR